MTALAKTFTLALCRCCFDRLTGEQYAEPPLASARFEYTRCHGPGCDYDHCPTVGWVETGEADVYSVTSRRAIDAPGR